MMPPEPWGPRRVLRLVVELPATLAALAMAAVVEVGLRVTTLPKLARFLGAPLAVAAESGPDTMPRSGPVLLPATARRQVRATRRVLRRWPFGDTCLRQALVSGQRLRRLGPELHVGVAKLEGQIRAHAWLTIDGGVLDPLASAAGYQNLTPPSRRTTP